MKYVYNITKIWYDEFETIESDKPLSYLEIRRMIDEGRHYCDAIEIDEETMEEHI